MHDTFLLTCYPSLLMCMASLIHLVNQLGSVDFDRLIFLSAWLVPAVSRTARIVPASSDDGL